MHVRANAHDIEYNHFTNPTCVSGRGRQVDLTDEQSLKQARNAVEEGLERAATHAP